MGKALTQIDNRVEEFITSQPLFFVATAPSGGGGHVNLSPKGLDTFRVLSPTQVAYLDLTGSGAETIAHLRQNGRITLMFNAFMGRPKIARLYGTGQAIFPSAADFPELKARFLDLPGLRSIIRVSVTRVSTSCGFGVPLMELKEERHELIDWATRRGESGIAAYQATKNQLSIDQLPAVEKF